MPPFPQGRRFLVVGTIEDGDPRNVGGQTERMEAGPPIACVTVHPYFLATSTGIASALRAS